MPPIRLLWLTENYPPQRGGMAQSCDRIVHGLRNRGYCIDLLHFTDKGKLKITQQINGQYITIPFDESESHTLNMAWNFLKQLPPPDAVICFGGYLSMLAAPVFSKWMATPLMTLIRGNDFDASIFTPRKKNVMEDAFAASSKVCVVSSDKKQKIEALYPHVDVAFIPNGIQAEEWIPSASETKFATEWRVQHGNDKIVVGLVGQLKAKKGVNFFFSSIENASLLADIHFLLIGELSEEVLTRISEKEISYTHYPFLDRYELLKYYLCCDAIAIPSFYDGMPNVLLEAGALGIPIVASNVDGMKDVITHAQTGFLFQAGHANACRKALYDFVNLSNEARKHMGALLKETIQSNYNDTLELDHYETIIKNMLGADRPSLQLRTAFE